MRYLSTRGKTEPQHFCDILLGGLAPDGGLFLPERYPRITGATLDRLRRLTFPELANAIFSLFIDDIESRELERICTRTFTPEVFKHCRAGRNPADITPLTTLEPNFHLLELSNGPTLAFKDVAMQLLGNLFEYVLRKRDEQLNILGATSGDTGSAAEYAMLGKKRIKVFMLSPEGKMSAFQRAQMYSLQDKGIFNIAIRGMFDDAQDVVKAVSNDAEFKAKYKIGAVNSINWARILGQVVYYFKGYFLATKDNDEFVDFAIPTGNFGNICAGHIARMMGLPIRHLILGTNENDVLDEFFRTGVYRPRTSAETHVTSSPSMDISKASNFERFIFDLVGRAPGTVRDLWDELEAGGSFSLRDTQFQRRLVDFGIVSGCSTGADRISTIRDVYTRYGVIIDTHTADAVKVAREYREREVPMVVLETAQATKFEETIAMALGQKPQRPRGFEGIENLPQHVEVMNADAEEVKAFIARHV